MFVVVVARHRARRGPLGLLSAVVRVETESLEGDLLGLGFGGSIERAVAAPDRTDGRTRGPRPASLPLAG